METWELKANIHAILISIDRPVTLQVLAAALDTDMDAIHTALQELEDDLTAADQPAQVRRRAHGLRLEVKAQFAERVLRVVPERSPKPISSQALETLAVIALKQPVAIGDINAIRGIESAGTVQTLRNRKLIARVSVLGPRREKYWRTTPLFLETFGLANLDELYQEGRLEEVFPAIYSAKVSAGDDPDDEGDRLARFESHGSEDAQRS
jgi:segregation and condensation protein B